MERRLMIKYCPEELSDSGVPLALICYDGVDSAPYLTCTILGLHQEFDMILPTRYLRYMEGLLHDVNVASNQSHDASILMLDRLEATPFGPIRCFNDSYN
jgi:hypothetical protein